MATRELGALAQRRELGPNDRRVHFGAIARLRGKPAVDASYHVVSPNQPGKAQQALGDPSEPPAEDCRLQATAESGLTGELIINTCVTDDTLLTDDALCRRNG